MAVSGRKLRDTLRFGSDFLIENPCLPCAKGNKDVESTKYCVNCNENICDQCESDHKRFAGMRGHQIENKPVAHLSQKALKFTKRPSLPREWIETGQKTSDQSMHSKEVGKLIPEKVQAVVKTSQEIEKSSDIHTQQSYSAGETPNSTQWNTSGHQSHQPQAGQTKSEAPLYSNKLQQIRISQPDQLTHASLRSPNQPSQRTIVNQIQEANCAERMSKNIPVQQKHRLPAEQEKTDRKSELVWIKQFTPGQSARWIQVEQTTASESIQDTQLDTTLADESKKMVEIHLTPSDDPKSLYYQLKHAGRELREIMKISDIQNVRLGVVGLLQDQQTKSVGKCTPDVQRRQDQPKQYLRPVKQAQSTQVQHTIPSQCTQWTRDQPFSAQPTQRTLECQPWMGRPTHPFQTIPGVTTQCTQSYQTMQGFSTQCPYQIMSERPTHLMQIHQTMPAQQRQMENVNKKTLSIPTNNCDKQSGCESNENSCIEMPKSECGDLSERKFVIKNVDMSEEMQRDAADCAYQALQRYNIEKDLAAYIKKEFDRIHKPSWHCIVGRNFGSYVTHETNHFIYFYLGQIAFLIFKSG